MESETLAQTSPLLQKAQHLGLRTSADLERLAVQRGCSYYDVGISSSVVREEPLIRVSRSDFSNAELAVALLTLYAPVSLLRQRMAAAMLSAPDVEPGGLAAIAIQEQCADIVHYIADCASRVEPDNEVWKQLQSALNEYPYDADGLPHPTRFIEMTGITRGRVGILKHWVRPIAALALAG